MRPQQQPRSAAAAAAALAAALLALLLVAGPAAALPAPQGDLREQVYRNFREDLEEAPIPRSLDTFTGVTLGGNKRLDPLSGGALGTQKRTFDEIDRMGFNGFVKKNFDEIDRLGFNNFVKKNFDEIDRMGFGSFVKRNAPALLALAARSLANGRVRRPMPSGLDSLSGVTFGTSKRLDPLSGGALGHQKRNFDELDRLAFNGLVKKNFDEIDRTGFDSFVKRNFDEIDRAGFGKFIKRNAPTLFGRYYRNHNH